MSTVSHTSSSVAGVEATLCQAIPLVIDLLLRLASIDVQSVVKRIVDKIRAQVKKAFDSLIKRFKTKRTKDNSDGQKKQLPSDDKSDTEPAASGDSASKPAKTGESEAVKLAETKQNSVPIAENNTPTDDALNATRAIIAQGIAGNGEDKQSEGDCNGYDNHEKETSKNANDSLSVINDLIHNVQGTRSLLNMTPREIADLTREELKAYLPVGWRFYEHNGRIHIKNEIGRFRIRVDPPDKIVPYTHIHIYDSNGAPLDISGNIVKREDAAAHIPYNF